MNAAEKEVDSATNLHTDLTHHSREEASDPLSMNQLKVPRSMGSGQAELVDNLSQHMEGFPSPRKDGREYFSKQVSTEVLSEA